MLHGHIRPNRRTKLSSYSKIFSRASYCFVDREAVSGQLSTPEKLLCTLDSGCDVARNSRRSSRSKHRLDRL